MGYSFIEKVDQSLNSSKFRVRLMEKEFQPWQRRGLSLRMRLKKHFASQNVRLTALAGCKYIKINGEAENLF